MNTYCVVINRFAYPERRERRERSERGGEHTNDRGTDRKENGRRSCRGASDIRTSFMIAAMERECDARA